MKTAIINKINEMGKTVLSERVYTLALEFIENNYDLVESKIEGMSVEDAAMEILSASWNFNYKKSLENKTSKVKKVVKALPLTKQEKIIAQIEKDFAAKVITAATCKKAIKFAKKNYDMVEFDVEKMSVKKAAEMVIATSKMF